MLLIRTDSYKVIRTGWGAGSRALLSYDDGLTWDMDHDYMILNAEDDFYPRGLLPSPTPPPSNYCTGWILPPHNAAVDVAAQAESRRLLHEDDKGEQCLQQSWRWAAVWGTIARQHVFTERSDSSHHPATRATPPRVDRRAAMIQCVWSGSCRQAGSMVLVTASPARQGCVRGTALTPRHAAGCATYRTTHD